MSEVGDEHARVAFPAKADFAAVGRVAVAGIALRLGIDVAQVESLRLAVSVSIEALAGAGTVTLLARWNDEEFVLELTNPDATNFDAPALSSQLEPLLIPAAVTDAQIRLVIVR